MSGDRLYTERDETLHVYSMNDLSSSIATYPLGGGQYASALISENRFFLGGQLKLRVYDLNNSLT